MQISIPSTDRFHTFLSCHFEESKYICISSLLLSSCSSTLAGHPLRGHPSDSTLHSTLLNTLSKIFISRKLECFARRSSNMQLVASDLVAQLECAFCRWEASLKAWKRFGNDLERDGEWRWKARERDHVKFALSARTYQLDRQKFCSDSHYYRVISLLYPFIPSFFLYVNWRDSRKSIRGRIGLQETVKRLFRVPS